MVISKMLNSIVKRWVKFICPSFAYLLLNKGIKHFMRIFIFYKYFILLIKKWYHNNFIRINNNFNYDYDEED